MEHKESIGHSPVNMWKMKLKKLEGKGNDNRDVGACSTNVHDSISDCVEKAKARAKCLDTLYKEEKCGIHVVSKLIVKIKP